MRRLLPALVLLAGCDGLSPGPTRTVTSGAVQTRPVELLPVSVAGLEAAVADLRGKVVLVDVWFLGCNPCKEKFPKFVELHHKYAADGLACVSVDMMPSELPDTARVLAFLQVQKARFPNYILSDDRDRVDAWTTKVGLTQTPFYLLFDRTGKRVDLPLTDSGEVVADDLEAVVRGLLAR